MMAREQSLLRRIIAWASFGFTSLAAVVLLGAYIFNAVHWFSSPIRGWINNVSGDPHIVAVTYEVAETAGLRVGDRVLTLNGGNFENFRELNALSNLELGDLNVYEVQRGEELLEIVVPTAEMGVFNTLYLFGSSLLAGIVFVAAGILVFLMKPRDGPSWSFQLFAMVLGVGFPYLWLGPSFEPAWLEGVFIPATYFASATILQLTVFFPQRRRLFADRWPLLLIPYGIAAVLSVVELSGDIRMPGTLATLRMAMLAGSVLIFMGSALQIWLRGESQATRIQALAVLTGGLLSGFVPTADNLYTSIVGVRLAPLAILPAFLFAFPVSVGYAIVQHDLFEIDMIIRRTYGYLLSTAVVIGLYGTVVSGLNLTVGPTDIMSSPFFSVAFILGMVFVMQPVQGRIQKVVDRAFYRQQYDYRATITAVSETMTTMLDPAEVQQTLVGSVVEEMFLENGILLSSEGTDFEANVVAGMEWPADRPRRVSLDPALRRALIDHREGVFRHEIELAPQYERDRSGMQASFDSLGAELMLPMVLKGEVRAVLSLGGKKSGKLFTREDIALLRTLINQGSIALENARLFAEVSANLKQIQMLETVKGNLAKFVPQTVQDLVEGSGDSNDLFEKRETDLTVMFADMVGYTKMSSQLPMDVVNDIIERYFGAFLDEILLAGGDVNETAGDGLMVLFQDSDPDRHARAAVSAAVTIQRLTRTINAERLAEDPNAGPIGMHIGINTGIASVGATKISGSTGMRWTYTASGPITNIAARVGALGEEIAITENTSSRLGEGFEIEEIGPQALKNVPEPVMAYRVMGAPEIGELDAPATSKPAELSTAASLSTEEFASRKGRFVILGLLTETETGRPLEHLLVRGFDKDLFFDDSLGEARSDADGRFEIRFTDEFFADVMEKRPDIYLKIFDPTGSHELLSTARSVRWNSGAIERFEIEIPKHLIDEGE
jgi:class 3 adenylate cyclase